MLKNLFSHRDGSAPSKPKLRWRSLEKELPSYYIDYGINISLKNRYVYIEVAKAACTTIKVNLQRVEYSDTPYDRPERPSLVHDRWQSPFVMPSQLQRDDVLRMLSDDDWPRFVFVRNPYTRVLSAYLDKIVRGRSQKAAVLKALGRDSEDLYAPLTFLEFLQALPKLNATHRDIHFRAQKSCAFAGKVKFHFVGSFEAIENDLRFVLEKIHPDKRKIQKDIRDETGHSTNSLEVLYDYFGDEEGFVNSKTI